MDDCHWLVVSWVNCRWNWLVNSCQTVVSYAYRCHAPVGIGHQNLLVPMLPRTDRFRDQFPNCCNPNYKWKDERNTWKMDGIWQKSCAGRLASLISCCTCPARRLIWIARRTDSSGWWVSFEQNGMATQHAGCLWKNASFHSFFSFVSSLDGDSLHLHCLRILG